MGRRWQHQCPGGSAVARTYPPEGGLSARLAVCPMPRHRAATSREIRTLPRVASVADQESRWPIQIPRPRSEEHTSELQSLMRISYAVFCLKKKNKIIIKQYYTDY